MATVDELQAEIAALRERLAAAERARDEVTAERDILHAALMQMPAQVVVMTGPEHVIRLVNPGWRAVVPGREPVGRPAAEALPELVETGLARQLQRVYETGEPFASEVTPEQPFAGGAPRWHSFQYVPLRRESGEIFGILYHGVDVTEQRSLEQERQRLQDELIAAQQQAIRELSTPLIPLADRLVLMPLVGTIDPARASRILEILLEGVTAQQAAVAILDVTGIKLMDEGVASAILKTASAARLLGTEVVLTGISPEVARALVELGADLSGVTTHGTLQSGVAHALTRVTARPRASATGARRPSNPGERNPTRSP